MMKVSGSMTVFLSMITLLILSILMTLAEGIRYTGLQAQTRLVSRTVTEGIFGEYNRILWEKYGILGMDMGYGMAEGGQGNVEEKMEESLEDNLSSSLYDLIVESCSLDQYLLLTDDGCSPFLRQAAEAEKVKLGEKLAADIKSAYEKNQDAAVASGQIEDLLEEEKKAGGLTKESGGEGITSDTSEQAMDESESQGNPADTVNEWKKTPILEQVLPRDVYVSKVKVNDENLPSARTLNQGTMDPSLNKSLGDQALYRLFVKDHFPHFVYTRSDPGKESNAPSYQLEYVLSGEKSDEENLEAVVKRLLMMREGENYAALLLDNVRCAQAQGLAYSIANAAQNQSLAEPIKLGIIAAWAYLESVLDLRALLAGYKIPVIKTRDEWTSGMWDIKACFDTSIMAKTSENGMDYESYLLMFLFGTKSDSIGIRCMDMIEYSLHCEKGYENVYVDHMICEMTCTYSFAGDPLLLKWVQGGGLLADQYNWCRREHITYL